jgi:hypothetical protein
MVIDATERSDFDAALWGYDAWNEPTHSTLWTSHWGQSLDKYSAWSSALATVLCPKTNHVMCIGSGGAVFGWSSAAFKKVSDNGWDVAQWHYYASAQDEYLVTDPLAWASASDMPLFVGEIANNAQYPHSRWIWYESMFKAKGGEALCSMTLRGTTSYPFTGTIPSDASIPPTRYDSGGAGSASGSGDVDELNDTLASIPPELIALIGGGLALSGLFIAGKYELLRLIAGVLLMALAAYQVGMFGGI